MNPWKGFEQASCLPDHCQCEGLRDALIRQTSSFWSSLFYVFAGLFLYRSVEKKSMDLKVWTMVCVLMGLSSMLGHGAFIRFTLAMDFTAIVLVMSFFGLWNLLNLLKLSTVKIFSLFSLYYLLILWAMYSMDKPAKIGICLLVFVFAISDVIREMGMKFLKARTLQLSILTLIISFAIFQLDENHYLCNSNSLWQFHSLWHFGTALSMFLYGKWRFEGFRN